jgi:NAD(P)-dependent dehydrogenase (short-subunit alcohol dehydrogenase family)
VNNAGVTPAKPVLELTADDFDSIFSIDVRAPFLLSQQAARRMAEGGAIVNVTSVHEHVPRVGFALYASAKAALGMLTKSLALELAPSIRVNAVAPGVTAT